MLKAHRPFEQFSSTGIDAARSEWHRPPEHNNLTDGAGSIDSFVFGDRKRDAVGNQREIRQVSPRKGLGVIIRVRPGHAGGVSRLLGDNDEQCRFYTYFSPAGEPIQFPNLDGPDVALGPQPGDHVVIQSGGKMWCGYEAFVDRLRALAPHLEDALFFVGDEEEYIDEFRLSGGELRYCRVHDGGWRPVDEFIRSLGLGSTAAPGTFG